MNFLNILLITKKKILQKSKLCCIYNKTDGAAVMKRVGRLLKVNHQLCLAHGIQLSLIKVLYKRSISENQEVAVTEFEHGEEEEEEVIEDIELFEVIEYT